LHKNFFVSNKPIDVSKGARFPTETVDKMLKRYIVYYAYDKLITRNDIFFGKRGRGDR